MFEVLRFPEESYRFTRSSAVDLLVAFRFQSGDQGVVRAVAIFRNDISLQKHLQRILQIGHLSSFVALHHGNNWLNHICSSSTKCARVLTFSSTEPPITAKLLRATLSILVVAG